MPFIRALASTFVVVLLFLATAGSTSAFAAPGNDDLAATVALGSDREADASGDNTGATKEFGEPNHAGSPGGHSVWFSWTASKSMGVRISTCANSFDTLLGVYTGSTYPLTEVASNDDEGENCEHFSEVRFNATDGTTYRIAVDSKDDLTGGFSLKVRQNPLNDDFDRAEVLSNLENPLPWWHEGNQSATKEAGEPNHAGNAGGHSVWFQWTAPSSGKFSFDTGAYYNGTCNSAFDTLLGVYTGGSYPLTEVGSDDDGSPCGHGASRVVVEATAGTVYDIVIDGKNGATGSLELQIRPQPLNDALASARGLLGVPHVFTYGHNQMATKESGEANHGGNAGGHSVWFSWTAPNSGHTVVSTCETSFDTVLGVYTGSALPLTQVVSDDDGADCGGGASRVEFEAVAGTAYKIAIDGKNGGEGTYNLDVRTSPGNDMLAATSVFSFPQVGDATGAFFSNELATKEAGEPDHAGLPGGHSIWVRWTPSVSARVRFATNQGELGCREDGIDTLLAVYTGNSYPLTEVASNDDGGQCGGGSSQVEFDAVAGTTYRIGVDGKNGAEGEFELAAWKQPANDALLAAKDLLLGGSATNVLATKEAGEPSHAGNAGGHSLWYFLALDQPKKVEINTCFSSLDTLLAVYSGTAFPLTPIASSDDACGQQNRILLAARAGKPYKVAVDGKDGAAGKIALNPTLSHEALETFLDSGPEGPTKEAQPHFSFHSNFADTDFLCRFDSGGFAACASGYAPSTPLAPGPHSFEVKASIPGLEDDASPASRSFVVAAPPEEVPPPKGNGSGSSGPGGPLDVSAPDSFFTRKPKGLLLTKSKARAARFAFGSNEAGSTFFCKLDHGDYEPCSSPLKVVVEPGSHKFRVLAVDAAGNQDPSPAQDSFKVRRR